MHAIEWLAQPICRLLTLTLLHFVWQGLAIALLLVVVTDIANLRRATARYACSLAALVAMTACPLFTLAWLALISNAFPTDTPHLANFDLSQATAHLSAPGAWLETAQP